MTVTFLVGLLFEWPLKTGFTVILFLPISLNMHLGTKNPVSLTANVLMRNKKSNFQLSTLYLEAWVIYKLFRRRGWGLIVYESLLC